MKGAKIIQLFTNVHMGLGHDGLGAIAKQHKKDPAKLGAGEVLMFLNRQHDKLKVLGPFGVLAYLRMPNNNRITLEAIQFIPTCLGGDGSIDYDTALKQAMLNTMASRASKKAKVESYQGGRA